MPLLSSVYSFSDLTFEKAAAEITATRPEYWEEKHKQRGEGHMKRKQQWLLFLYLNRPIFLKGKEIQDSLGF